MTKDLEETLAELGPGYREVVDRVVGAYGTCEGQRWKVEQRNVSSSSVQPPTSNLQPVSNRRIFESLNAVRSAASAARPQIDESINRKIEKFAAPGRVAGWSAAYLVAASLLVFLGLGAFFCEPTVRGTSDSRLVYTVAYAPNESALATILASQRSDGSWDNDFITRQNAAALRSADALEMRVAYKKAVRYLRSRGLRPLSDAELKARGDEAARLLAKI